MGDHAGASGREIAPGSAPGHETAEELDLRGEVCPYTFLKTRLALEELPAGRVLRVILDSEASARDVPRSLAGAGHAVLACAPAGNGTWVILTRRGPV